MTTTRFKNITTDTLSVNAPEGHPDSHLVESGGVLQVEGKVSETDDAYVVEIPDTDIDHGGFVQPDGSVTPEKGEKGEPNRGPERRAYPKAIWKREGASKSTSKGADK